MPRPLDHVDEPGLRHVAADVGGGAGADGGHQLRGPLGVGDHDGGQRREAAAQLRRGGEARGVGERGADHGHAREQVVGLTVGVLGGADAGDDADAGVGPQAADQAPPEEVLALDDQDA